MSYITPFPILFCSKLCSGVWDALSDNLLENHYRPWFSKFFFFIIIWYLALQYQNNKNKKIEEKENFILIILHVQNTFQNIWEILYVRHFNYFNILKLKFSNKFLNINILLTKTFKNVLLVLLFLGLWKLTTLNFQNWTTIFSFQLNFN